MLSPRKVYVLDNKKSILLDTFYYSVTSTGSSVFSSFFFGFGSASFLEKFCLPFLSGPCALTMISSPNWTTSSTLSTLSCDNWEIWTSPSHPGHNCTKHPNSSILTTFAS